MKPIPYGRQQIGEDDIEAVCQVLRSDFLTQGPAVERFERAVADYCGARYAVAVSNATAALHLGCLALDAGPGDRIWTSPNSFVASANCALYAGATVDFVDIDPETYNMSAAALAEKLQAAEKTGKLPKLVIPVHHSGQSCEMDQIRGLSKKYGFKVMEDASHAIGGSYRNKKVGSCDFSDLCVFSFHPVKIITTGEGGMVLTNDPVLFQKLVRLRSHGVTRDASQMTRPPEGPWYYQQLALGWNYRMTDMQAALGLSQLGKIDGFVRRRHVIASAYGRMQGKMPLSLPKQRPECYSAFHLYAIRLKLEGISKPKKRVFEELHSQGIMVNLHYIPIHRQPYYEKLGFSAGQFRESEKYYDEAMSLPLHPGMSDEDQSRVISCLQETLL